MNEKPSSAFPVVVLDRTSNQKRILSVSGGVKNQEEAELTVFLQNAMHRSLHPGLDVVPRNEEKFETVFKDWVMNHHNEAVMALRGLLRLDDHISPYTRKVAELVKTLDFTQKAEQ